MLECSNCTQDQVGYNYGSIFFKITLDNTNCTSVCLIPNKIRPLNTGVRLASFTGSLSSKLFLFYSSFQLYNLMEVKTPYYHLPIHTSSFRQPLTIPLYQQQYISKKVPLAQKSTLQQYRRRTVLHHPNIPTLILEITSPFYFTVHAERTAPFSAQHLRTMAINIRIKLIIDILKAVVFLVCHFGYFYVLEGMVGYRLNQRGQRGEVTVWINSQVFRNDRKSPIDHALLSEEIFIQDFKSTYIGQLPRCQEFDSAKTIKDLLKALVQKQHIHQSLHVRQLPSKPSELRSSLITFSRSSNIDISPKQWRQRATVTAKQPLSFSKHPTNRCSLNYATRRLQRKQTAASIYIDKYSGYEGTFRDEQSRRASIYHSEGDEIILGRRLGLSTSCSHFTNVPQSPLNLSSEKVRQKFEGKNAKPGLVDDERRSLCTQSWQEQLKFSFPHTTTHSFHPYQSNGNLIISCSESAYLEKPFMLLKEEVPSSRRISQEQLDVQMELNCLFSRSNSDVDGMLNLSSLVEEFQQMLSA